MTLQKATSGRAIREVLAAAGVIASLVFVGFEIRQNTAAVHDPGFGTHWARGGR